MILTKCTVITSCISSTWAITATTLSWINTSWEVAFTSRILTISSSFTISFSRVSWAVTRLNITLKQLTMFTKALDAICFIVTICTFKMAGYFPTFAILSWLIQTACFQQDGKEDDQKGGRSTVNIIFAVHSRVCFWKNRVNLEEHFYNTINCILTLQVWKSRCNFN